MASPSEAVRAAEAVVDLARSRPPTLGPDGRLVCVDGPAGSGKTTLAAAVAGLTGGHVVHVDELIEGWEGLFDSGDQLASAVRPLAEGRPGSYRAFDWHAYAFADPVPVPLTPWLVVEGVGSGSPAIADLVTVLVWVSVDDDLRLARGLARDGAAAEPHWRRWMVDERALFARDHTEQRADVVVDGTGSTAPVVRSRRGGEAP
ncbi:uridine kinase [Nocardioides sp. SYSU D00038]|uniref:uridine kinase family protein n=1 Tax=Nocardioides sp. SYSU D00038 TaxID=2812554 RepID=UPI0019679DB7|nr:4-amino-4-deoxy-L-arabinose transferase [Nocardioides sp. SYSU D00038]